MTDRTPDPVTDDNGTTTLAATGNGMKSHDRYDTFLEVSGGSGNHDDGAEVHLRLRSNDGHNEGQAWFAAADLLAAVQQHTTPPSSPSPGPSYVHAINVNIGGTGARPVVTLWCMDCLSTVHDFEQVNAWDDMHTKVVEHCSQPSERERYARAAQGEA